MKKVIICIFISFIFMLSGCKVCCPIESDIDLSMFFNNKDACTIFYKDNRFDIYNKEMVDVRESPCSTFKIVITLAGLKYGILKDENTLIKWDGVERYFDYWNKDLTLKEAFNLSAIWYFEKVANEIGKEDLTNFVNELSYGNCDASGDIPFWLDSTLKISPKEQVEFIKDLFEYKFSINKNHVDLLKAVMRKENINGGTLYGKTGTSKEGNNSWFVGAYEKIIGICILQFDYIKEKT